jgi:hypothetical protein
MNSEVSDAVKALPQMTREQLLAAWQQHFGKPAPPGVRRELLVPMIAYRIQENAYGGLPESTRAKLREIALSLEGNRKPHAMLLQRYKPGTRLIREWGGRRHEVRILEKGFEYQGKHYDSLSVIARTITGTPWSGPVFFGLKKSKTGASKK